MTDIPVNPQALVTNGALVNSSNPLPCRAYSTPASKPDVTLNPVTFVVNGAIVTTANPLPIKLV
jgi:hypothetical protein